MDGYSASFQRPVIIQALLQCNTVEQILAQAQDGYVHSVFKHACNIGVGAEIVLTLQTRHMSLAPGGCILLADDLQSLFCQGEPVSFENSSTILSCHCEVRLAEAPRHSLRLNHHVALPELRLLRQRIFSFLLSTAPASGFFPLLHRLHDHRSAGNLALSSEPDRALTELSQWLKQPDNVDELPDILRKLVGFGIGLTPAADDFILGVLLVMDVVDDPSRRYFVHALEPLLVNTTDISAAMLRYGCAGYYAEQLLTLLSSSGGLSAKNLKRVADYGHSSGYDMLCGIAFTLENLKTQSASRNAITD